MEYQNLGRQQRSQGTNMKQTLLVMLLVVCCAWLLYQINRSRNKPDNYGGPPKLVEQYGTVSLGRKGRPSWLDETDFPSSGKVHIVGPKLINSGREGINSGNTDDRSSRSESDDRGQANEKEAEVVVRGPPNGWMRMNTEPDGSIKENEEVEEGDWNHGFDDENGVPPEVNETEAIGGVVHLEMEHEENISNDSKEGRASKSNIYEVTSSSSENGIIVEITLGGSTLTDVNPEVNSQSNIAYVDKLFL